MRELEEKLAEWRSRLPESLRADSATVAELEEHLREHVAALGRNGVGLDAAFAAAVQRLGEPSALAQQFACARRRWLPDSRGVRSVLALIGLLVVALVAAVGTRRQIGGLLLVHVLIITAGYLMVLGAGLLGLWTLVTIASRPFTASVRGEVRAAMFGFTVAASVLVPVGMVLGMFWAAENTGEAWAWRPVENGALLVLVSSWLLLLVQTRLVASERVRAALALLGGVGVVVAFSARPAVTNAVPITWLCLALIASQGAVLLLRRRTAHEREHA